MPNPTSQPKETLGGELARIGIVVPEIVELFDYLEDTPLWIKDNEGTYLWVNSSFIINFGFKHRSEIIGHNDYDLCGETLANQYRIDDERVLRGEHILSRLELVGRFDHTARWCLTSKIPLHDEKGDIVGNAGITRPKSEDATTRATGTQVGEAVRYIGKHYKEPITNKELAATCNLSVRALERQFRVVYGHTPHDYIRRIRVRMSCTALVTSSKSIAEIASEFGFSDQSHFGKEFRRVTGETPKQYRSRF
ncbi:AraC family transcriptional regulator [Pelagicoccus sp. SDUM812002]|uniref:AraC family transcriptional regulator n=1 Tax=Pelagicoccus sp. SDUM812002 TaxID=3041266 RepID=UPI00280CB06C|nr:AraC family transcriptional regulator [Pelagicoccus sp. SDUM812002]MDQ8184631.1 AraC family transcriptional regulator [Pelagicoccus sp. SDUM812002]